MMDHYHQIPGVGPQTNYMFEGNTMLAALAARTSKASLGLLVGGVMYRNPAALAKITTGIDVISGGRAVLGLGAAWFEDEHRAYGFDFPPLKERFEHLEDALNIARAMFTAGGRDLRGHAPLDPRRAEQPAPAARRHPDPDRRQRREEDAADGRPVRRRLELLRRPRARRASARRARGPLRPARPRHGRDHQDPHGIAVHRRDARGRAGEGRPRGRRRRERRAGGGDGLHRRPGRGRRAGPGAARRRASTA